MRKSDISGVVVLAGLGALIAVTAAGGWVPQSSGTTAEFRGLVPVDLQVVWASGTGGRVARTVDGGATWRVDTVAGATALDFRSLAALDAQTAIVASAGEAERGLAQLHRTTDGGRSWTRVFSTEERGVFFDALAFWDDRRGIALSDPVDGRLYLLLTDDGGRSWVRISPERLPRMLEGEAMFAASNTSMAVQPPEHVWIATGGASRARVIHSADGGHSWQVVDTPVHSGDGSAGIFSIAFADARRGIVVGGDYRQPRGLFPNVALTEDGGRQWRPARGPLPPGYMSAVSYVPGTDGRTLVAVGLAGTALSLDGGDSWTLTDSTAYNAVAFAGAGAGWAAGPRGRISRWQGDIIPALPIRK
jgi:photosystem II stability/assembly factor-like uncharacterized protein